MTQRNECYFLTSSLQTTEGALFFFFFFWLYLSINMPMYITANDMDPLGSTPFQ